MPDATILRATTLQARASKGGDRNRVVIATAAVDRNRRRVRAFTVENFAANPVLRYGHDGARLPIGSVSNVTIAGAGTLEMRLEGTIEIDRAHEFAAAVGDLWDRGLLNMVSYGAQAPIGAEVQDVYDEATGRYLFTDYATADLLEVSVVDVGANPAAVRLAASLGVAEQARLVFEAAAPTHAPGGRPVGPAKIALNRARLQRWRR